LALDGASPPDSRAWAAQGLLFYAHISRHPGARIECDAGMSNWSLEKGLNLTLEEPESTAPQLAQKQPDAARAQVVQGVHLAQKQGTGSRKFKWEPTKQEENSQIV
jgi:hypothetical protein